MPCGFGDPLVCAASEVIGGGVSSVANSAWDAICNSFASAANALLSAFAKMFVAIPPVDLNSPGIKTVYGICLGIAAVIAVLLLLGQVIRTVITHDGSALATGIIGIAKAALAFMLTLVIASAALTAADDITAYIVNQSFGSSSALAYKIANLMPFAASGNPAGGVTIAASLILLLSIVGILLIIVLWFEMLLRNAAIAVLVATSPIAASGLLSDATKSWWPKLVSATAQLIILKPVIALVFALGFAMTGQSQDIETLLAGMLVLLLAVVAWPVIARFFTFATVQAGGSAGLGMMLGFAAGRVGGGGGAPAGIAPDEFSMAAEARTMGAAGGGSGATAAGAAGGAAAAGIPALVAAGVQAAHRAVGALSGQMEQMAGHAGIAPAFPAGYGGGSARSGGGSGGGQSGAQAPPPLAEPPEIQFPADPDPGLGEFTSDNPEDGI